MNNLDVVYQSLLEAIIASGVEKKDRTGTGTLSLFGYQIRHDMSEGFPLLTTKKMAWKSIVTELLWFLRGDTNIKYLVNKFLIQRIRNKNDIRIVKTLPESALQAPLCCYVEGGQIRLFFYIC